MIIRAIRLIRDLHRELRLERSLRREAEEKIRVCNATHDSMMGILLQRHEALERYRGYAENMETALKHCAQERDVLRDLLDRKGADE